MAGMPLMALTIHQPWAWAIAAGHKPVENREWAPPQVLVGRPLAIHAGRKHDAKAAIAIHRELGLELPGELVFGAVIAVAVLDRVARPLDRDPIFESPWFRGPVGWVLRDVVRIEPVECRGYQKLWPVRGRELELVRERYRSARARGAAAQGGGARC